MLVPVGCRATNTTQHRKGETPMSITITSDAFADGEPIPKIYTGEGMNASPHLQWSSPPPETAELALICDDPDAPGAKPWVHWVLYKIPGNITELPEGVSRLEYLSAPIGAIHGVNSFGKVGYDGPMPPRGYGVHHYHFKIYALDEAVEIEPKLDKAAVLKAIRPHIIAQGELVGTYER